MLRLFIIATVLVASLHAKKDSYMHTKDGKWTPLYIGAQTYSGTFKTTVYVNSKSIESESEISDSRVTLGFGVPGWLSFGYILTDGDPLFDVNLFLFRFRSTKINKVFALAGTDGSDDLYYAEVGMGYSHPFRLSGFNFNIGFEIMRNAINAPSSFNEGLNFLFGIEFRPGLSD
jgi:hypothetical protein